MLLRAFLLSLFILLFVPYTVSDAQTTGQTRNNGNSFQIFDGTIFDTPDYGSLGGCSTAGQMNFSGGKLRFCNGSTWRNLDSGVNNGGCSNAGQIRRNTTWLEFCNGSNWRKINPTHINGACLNEGGSNNLCNDGTANDAAIADTSAQWRWRCDGLYGGSNSGTCYKNKPVNGVCTNEGASNNLCAAGTANDGAIADTGAQWRWRCDGQYGGSNSGTCYKNKPVNGVCNNSGRNLCSAGSSNDGAISDTTTHYRWRCDGQYGGSNSGTCSYPKPINGVCNNSTRNACSAGVSNDGAISDTTTQYRWRCDGQYGGSNSGTCAITRPGVCGSAASGGAVTSQPTSNQCSYGTYQDLSDTGSYWQWRCNGNPNSSTCQRARAAAPINGVCNNASRNACSAGVANDGAISDTTTQYRWRCDGQNGGSNSGTCAITRPGVCGSAASGGAVSSQPTSNQCSYGTYTDLSDTASYWQWRCNGNPNSGTCQRARSASSVNGVCGSANGSTILAGFPSGSAACSSGTYQEGFAFPNPRTGVTNYSWSCMGSGGGSDASCSGTGTGGGGGGGCSCFATNTGCPPGSGPTTPYDELCCWDYDAGSSC
ncbi:MAG: hypothetical protein CMH32_03475 [Micavibrio sp.]|nr:hypothetical protein [Micavibrio sp.]